MLLMHTGATVASPVISVLTSMGDSK